jgi:hypothetical protein
VNWFNRFVRILEKVHEVVKASLNEAGIHIILETTPHIEGITATRSRAIA